MDIYTLVVFFLVILILVYLVVVAFYTNRVNSFSIPTSGESSLLFWVTILFIVLIVILLIYTMVRFFYNPFTTGVAAGSGAPVKSTTVITTEKTITPPGSLLGESTQMREVIF